ncbi:MAG: hypothetical protein KC591_15360 [Gemmatimonadetes bacterium]|nr:hypothetical protein [Gemmatimonadota bacterium]
MKLRFSWLALAVLATPVAHATPHHAHWHYQIGARANTGQIFAKQLWWEASQPGELSLELAHVNAVDMARLAREIGDWVAATEATSRPEDVARIELPLQVMTQESARLAAAADALAKLVADAIPEGPDEETRTQIAWRATVLFHGFRTVLAQHKRAELALGIPVPEDPPAVKHAGDEDAVPEIGMAH